MLDRSTQQKSPPARKQLSQSLSDSVSESNNRTTFSKNNTQTVAGHAQEA